jgi:hypothetical protein
VKPASIAARTSDSVDIEDTDRLVADPEQALTQAQS